MRKGVFNDIVHKLLDDLEKRILKDIKSIIYKKKDLPSVGNSDGQGALFSLLGLDECEKRGDLKIEEGFIKDYHTLKDFLICNESSLFLGGLSANYMEEKKILSIREFREYFLLEITIWDDLTYTYYRGSTGC